jgi:putative copper resistance protein D
VNGEGTALLFAAARWLGYLAAFLVVGSAAARWRVFPRARPPVDRDRARATAVLVARAGTVLLAVALVLKLYLQSRSLLEPEEPVTLPFVVTVLESGWGMGWLAQATAALIALIGWRRLARRDDRVARWLALGGTAAIVATAPLTGHAVGGAPGYTPFLDLIHFGAAATWLGSLAIVFIVLERQGDPSAAGLIESLSPVALAAGVATMAAGAILGWTHLGGLSPLVTTQYGQALLLKLGATGLTAAIGAYNWRVIGPRLRRGLPAPIRRSAAAELAVGLLLLAITAVLVSLPAPRESPD